MAKDGPTYAAEVEFSLAFYIISSFFSNVSY